ncbi:cytochrome c-type biogenesis protein [Legionella jamestowniensis]|uniref:Cytochrome c-type biogenesis protein n=1 Tax=Legionella jamestowniensis TaxID=455 RepID=A0A0W0UFR2_9GAMM|nr:cytochrome c-type biogenesis protein [Legionella jamestowniensis]KTD06724.1 cytochrome c-type biogenesis protein CcmH [Legionella jamestowniensis]OCH97391.1 cytochrome C biogenesis protein [Legionella jamestowniensis]SFL84142.1 cytochrome c-type biogenesis protein CcmH [Legionella jamestowniensis DSM 19215]
MRNSNVFLFLIFILFGTVSIANNALYPLENAKQEAQFSHLLKELRCLVCQNQDLADSNASLAKDLRDQVYNLVREGKADSEIIDYLTARYGDFILFKPPVKPLTAFLWFGPVIFLLSGFIIFWRTCLKRSSNE